MLIHVRDPWSVEMQPLEFPGALVLALDPPLSLHDHGPWLEWAPDAVEGRRRIYDLGRHLLSGDDVCVKADGLVVVEFSLARDPDGWHISLRRAGGVANAALPDFEPEESTGLQIPLGAAN